MVLVRHPLIEGIVIVLDGSQHLAIGILWYRTITQVYTACNFFLLPRRWQFLRAEKIRKNILEIKKGGKCKRMQPIVKARPEYERFKFVSWTYQILFRNKQWQHNFLDLLLIVCWWKRIMIREVRCIFDICHNMQLTLAQLEMFVQSTVNILEHLQLNKWSKVAPGPHLLKYEQCYLSSQMRRAEFLEQNLEEEKCWLAPPVPLW